MASIFDKVNSPADLKQLTYPELENLAEELRSKIVDTISANGGHLASSLGVVELTIAIHRVFASPVDKIVWDVGHQSYAHKLLTERKDRFSTIRHMDGLSGFPCREESPYDAFTTGHAGTSISAAIGIACARDLYGENYHVVSVTGDGSLGAGMEFEAINHAGHSGTRIIVILNDNGMSISPTQGAVSRLLNQVRLDSRYEFAKNRARKFFDRIPLGGQLLKLIMQAKTGFRRVVLPGVFWEQLGFLYLGPFDGHNIRDIESALIRARDFEHKPVIIHVLTTKGKGYPEAEKNATKYHGVSPAEPENENTSTSYSQVFGQSLRHIMQENPRVVAISAAMLDGTGLATLLPEFPGRIIDVGICEQHAVTLAAGMASQGYIPVVAIYSTFLQRSYDQIIHDVCLQQLPVVFAIDRAGIVGEDGATHQGAFDISYMSSIPGMIVAAPKDEKELQLMLYTAIYSGKPMSLRYPRGNGYGVALESGFRSIPIGKAELIRDGSDAAILAIGSMVYPAIKAASSLYEKEKLKVAVVNARFAKPLDSEVIVGLAQKTRRLLTVEENSLNGGFGSSVLDLLAGQRMSGVRVERIGIPDEFVKHGKIDFLQAGYGLDSAGIIKYFKVAFPELLLYERTSYVKQVKHSLKPPSGFNHG